MSRGGRGGKSSSFTHEQLQAMGVTSKEMQTVAAAPPPLYPTLMSKPVQLDTTNDREYKILWKEDFLTFLKDSPYHLNRKNSGKSFLTYSEVIANNLETVKKSKIKCEFINEFMPPELRPNFKRVKKDDSIIDVKKIKTIDVVDKLKVLEEKEKTEKDEEVVGKPKTTEDDDDEDVEPDEMEDEEMDDENDYGNNYFDNGESFNDEDDNLDDGPIY